MEIHEAAKILKHNYNTAPKGGKSLAVHLFAIKYADEIADLSVKKLLEYAGLSKNYDAEINKGKNIAPHVIFKG